MPSTADFTARWHKSGKSVCESKSIGKRTKTEEASLQPILKNKNKTKQSKHGGGNLDTNMKEKSGDFYIYI